MLRALIVDDEAPARKRLLRLLRPLETAHRLEVLGEAADGVDALEQINRKSIDLLFLDIQMPEMNGFDVLERLPPEDRPGVIFTTAYDDYALRAFNANVIDYLLKPISTERLEQAVVRAEGARRTPQARRLDDDRIARLLDWIDAQAEPVGAAAPVREQDYMRQISIPYRDRILLIPVMRLVSAEVSEGITRLHVLDDQAGPPKSRLRQHIVNYTLDQLEASLNPDAFLRVHRSAIIQLDHIQELIPWFSGRYKLVMSGEHEVIASRERSKLLKDRLLL